MGAAIRTLRKSVGLTLEQVATEAGVSINYLSRAENGKVAPTPTWCHLVMTVLGGHVEDAA